MALAVFLAPLDRSVSRGARHPDPGGEATGKEIYRRTLRSTCWVLTKNRMGTGWLLDAARCEIITNYHVVGDDDVVAVIFPEFADGKPIVDRAEYLKKNKMVKGKVISKDSRRATWP